MDWENNAEETRELLTADEFSNLTEDQKELIVQFVNDSQFEGNESDNETLIYYAIKHAVWDHREEYGI